MPDAGIAWPTSRLITATKNYIMKIIADVSAVNPVINNLVWGHHFETT
jgi:hypothetical protein